MKTQLLITFAFASLTIQAQNTGKAPAVGQTQTATAPKKNVAVSPSQSPGQPPANVKPQPSGPGTAPTASPSTEPAPRTARPATRSGASKAVKYKDAKIKKQTSQPVPAQK